MGNLLSIHAEIFLKRDSNGKIISPLETASKLLENLNGRSYNGYPIVLKEHWNGNKTSYRISYGDKMEPRSLYRFYENNFELIERIFARTFDETGDWDWMISFPNNSRDYYEIRRKCRYSFDMLRYKPQSTGNYEEVQIKGTFNSQSGLNLQENRNLVNIPIEYLNSLKTYSELELETDNPADFDEIFFFSNHIKFIDKGITVHEKIEVNEYLAKGYKINPSEFMAVNYNRSMYDIFSCGWSNCADEEYLKYMNEIKKESNT